LKYTAASGADERPVIVHRAVMGSIERMFAVLVEHTAGKWPLWLSPRQCVVVPVTEKQHDYAEAVRKQLHAAGIMVRPLPSPPLPSPLGDGSGSAGG
jgi:threonyl-tRNA synthetase